MHQVNRAHCNKRKAQAAHRLSAELELCRAETYFSVFSRQATATIIVVGAFVDASYLVLFFVFFKFYSESTKRCFEPSAPSEPFRAKDNSISLFSGEIP